MFLDFIFDVFVSHAKDPAIIYNDDSVLYRELYLDTIQHIISLRHQGIKEGDIVALRSDFSTKAIPYLLALIEIGTIVVPISPAVKDIENFYTIAGVQYAIDLVEDTTKSYVSATYDHKLYTVLRKRKHPGLVLFSSGSTGKPKAAVHDFVYLLKKFKTNKPALKILTFLLFDHIGGINTLFYVLSTGGTAVIPSQRTPDYICSLIEKHHIEILPTSPTFLNMILIGKAYQSYDLSSLKAITYGTEIMPESVLQTLSAVFPNAKLKQTYGLSELGIMRTKSAGNDSLWVKVGGEDYETKIVNDTLYIKAKSAMLGYLNAPSPFDQDGWFNTQDRVEQNGDWIRFLGRQSDIINVGGQKVYPAEVESVLLQMPEIIDISVYGKSHPLTQMIVAAKITVEQDMPLSHLKHAIRKFCVGKLENYKVPVSVTIVNTSQVTDRFKKIR